MAPTPVAMFQPGLLSEAGGICMAQADSQGHQNLGHLQMDWQRPRPLHQSSPVLCQVPPPPRGAPPSQQVPAWMEQPTQQTNTDQLTTTAVLDQWKSSPSRALAIDKMKQLLGVLQRAPAPTRFAQGPAAAMPVAMPHLCGPQGSAVGLARGGGVAEKTLMVHNVPPDCTVERLLEEWSLDGTFDFLYLPMSSAGKRAVGFAFINFPSSHHAEEFGARWHGCRLSWATEGRRLRVVEATVQGLDANVNQLKAKLGSRFRSRLCRPIILRNGQAVSLEDF